MHKLIFVIIAVLALSAMLLAPEAYAQGQMPAANPAANQDQTKATVIFYYPGVPMKNCLQQVPIYVDSVNVHQIGTRHVWKTQFTPGAHVFSDGSIKSEPETKTLAAGQTYYYEMLWRKGWGFPTCDKIWISFPDMKSGHIQKTAALFGKPGVDETSATPVAAAEAPKSTAVKVAIISTPHAADIEVDGSFVGNTPSTFELSPGEHNVVVSKNGYKPWQRKVKVAAGEINLNAELEADPAKP